MFKQLIQYFAYTEEGGAKGGGARSGSEETVVKTATKVSTTKSAVSVPTISSINLDTGNLQAVATGRPLTIRGDEGSEIIINIVATSGSDIGKFYNFKTNSFSASHKFTNDNNLRAVIKDGIFTSNISFPASGGDSYKITAIAPGDKQTVISGAISKSGGVVSKDISRTANTQITFSLGTASSSDYQTLPSNVTSTASPIKVVNTPATINWTVENTEDDSNGFGLKLASATTLETFNWNKAWYFETTETIDGNVASDENIVVVDDITDLVAGMELIYITGTTAPGAKTYITAVDIPTKTLTLSRDQALSDGNTMTFRAYGSRIIEKVTGMSIDFGKFKASSAALTKTVRRAVSGSTTINLDGTFGIAGGNSVTYTGAKVNNTAANAVTSVSASSSAGSIVVQLAQTLTEDTVLTFSGSTQSIKITGKPIIKKYPTSNRTIKLDLDKFITVGAAS